MYAFLVVMKMRDQIIAISDRYCELAGVGRKRVSTIVLGRGSKLDDIAAGGDLVTSSFEKALQWFGENWPEGEAWPKEVFMPSIFAGGTGGPSANLGREAA